MTGLDLDHLRSICERATLLQCDCREVLPHLPRVDAVVTDPPYGIGFKYRSHNDNAAEYADLIGHLKGLPLALLQYPEEMMRLVVPVLGAPDECLAWVYPSNVNRQFRLWGIWGLSCDFSAVPQRARNADDPRVNEWVASYDWWEQPQVKNVSEEKTAHPCQIPATSVERVLRLTGAKSAVDPFMGSGTTGVACARLGLPFWGIERDPEYFDIACKRIEQAQRQGDFFVEASNAA
jgi:site-specific DNA-methyltransferase (adenine-specific)